MKRRFMKEVIKKTRKSEKFLPKRLKVDKKKHHLNLLKSF